MRFDEWREDRRKGHLKRLGPFVLLSLFIFWLILPLVVKLVPDKEPLKSHSVEMRTVSAKQRMENKSIRQKATAQKKTRVTENKPEEKKPEPEKKKPEPEKPDGQIVDIAMPEKEERPDDAKRLSQYDSKVKKESKARDTSPEENVTVKRQKKGLKKPKRKVETSENKLVMNTKPQPSKSGALQNKSLMIPDLKMAMRLDLDEKADRGTFKNRRKQERNIKGNSDRLQAMFEEQKKSIGRNRIGMPSNNIPRSLLPSLDDTLDVTQGAPMNDYLEKVDEGDETWLNTKGFKYAVFYNRVKRKVAQNWHPVEAQRRYDPYFRIHGYKTRDTVLFITLDGSGVLEDAELVRSSGVDFLDQAALSAVNKAAPFPNPPPGIIEEGRIKFPFRFVFELNRSVPVWKNR